MIGSVFAFEFLVPLRYTTEVTLQSCKVQSLPPNGFHNGVIWFSGIESL